MMLVHFLKILLCNRLLGQ